MSPADASRAALARLVAEHGDDLPLDRAMLLVAQEESPALDVPHYLGVLDALGAQARTHIADGQDPAAAIAHTLFDEASFRGNAENYYDPKNSLFDEVLDRRLGIPITLSILYIEVARRAGSKASGIGFPGHFLVRHESAGRSLLVDPFNRGAVLRLSDCERLLAELGSGAKELEPWMLAASTPRAILLRVLTNLKHAYMLQKDLIGAIRALDRLLIVEPERWGDRRDRGLLFVELELVGPALRDLEAYVDHAREGRDVELIRRVLPDLRAQRTVMN